MNETRVPGFGTLCIHAGQEPEPVTGAVSVPIFQTSTYAQDALGSPRGGFTCASHASFWASSNSSSRSANGGGTKAAVAAWVAAGTGRGWARRSVQNT